MSQLPPPTSPLQLQRRDTMDDAELTKLATEILLDIGPKSLSTMVNIDSTDSFILKLAEEYNNDDCNTQHSCLSPSSPPSLYNQKLTFSQLPSLPQRTKTFPSESNHNNTYPLHSKSTSPHHQTQRIIPHTASEPMLMLSQRRSVKSKVSVIPNFTANKYPSRKVPPPNHTPKRSKSDDDNRKKKTNKGNRARSSSVRVGSNKYYEYAVETEYGMEFICVNESEYDAFHDKY